MTNSQEKAQKKISKHSISGPYLNKSKMFEFTSYCISVKIPDFWESITSSKKTFTNYSDTFFQISTRLNFDPPTEFLGISCLEK